MCVISLGDSCNGSILDQICNIIKELHIGPEFFNFYVLIFFAAAALVRKPKDGEIASVFILPQTS